MLMVKNIFEKVFFYALKNSSRLRRHKNKYSKKNLHAHTTQCIGLNHKNKIAKVCLTKTFDLYYYYYLSWAELLFTVRGSPCKKNFHLQKIRCDKSYLVRRIV